MPPIYWSTGQPVVDGPAIGRPVGQPRIREPGEIPGRVHERVHGVGLAPALAAAARAVDMLPGRVPVEGVAGHVEADVLGQHDGQVLLGNRHHAAGVAVDDRDRAAPVALARDAPVPQTEIHLPLRHRPVAAGLGFQAAGDLVLGGLDAQAIEEARVDHPAIAVIGGVGDRERRRIRAGRAHDGRVAEAVAVDEVQVALVVRRAAEDGTRCRNPSG